MNSDATRSKREMTRQVKSAGAEWCGLTRCCLQLQNMDQQASSEERTEENVVANMKVELTEEKDKADQMIQT